MMMMMKLYFNRVPLQHVAADLPGGPAYIQNIYSKAKGKRIYMCNRYTYLWSNIYIIVQKKRGGHYIMDMYNAYTIRNYYKVVKAKTL